MCKVFFLCLRQRFSNHGSPRLRGMVAKTCKLPHAKEKELRTQDFKSENPFLKEYYDFKMKI